jgi:hypothetical protein
MLQRGSQVHSVRKEAERLPGTTAAIECCWAHNHPACSALASPQVVDQVGDLLMRDPHTELMVWQQVLKRHVHVVLQAATQQQHHT